MFAKIVAIEGGDSCGKHTQAVMLRKKLIGLGHKTALVEVPVRDHLTHKLIYSMLRSGAAKRHPNLFQFVQFTNKLLFQVTCLLWLWVVSDFVVLDRWALSSIVYGKATGSNVGFCEFLYRFLIEPHMTIVLDGPTLSREREKDVYEQDTELQASVKESYREWAKNDPLKIVAVSNVGSELVVHIRLLNEVARFL